MRLGKCQVKREVTNHEEHYKETVEVGHELPEIKAAGGSTRPILFPRGSVEVGHARPDTEAAEGCASPIPLTEQPDKTMRANKEDEKGTNVQHAGEALSIPAPWSTADELGPKHKDEDRIRIVHTINPHFVSPRGKQHPQPESLQRRED